MTFSAVLEILAVSISARGYTVFFSPDFCNLTTNMLRYKDSAHMRYTKQYTKNPIYSVFHLKLAS